METFTPIPSDMERNPFLRNERSRTVKITYFLTYTGVVIFLIVVLFFREIMKNTELIDAVKHYLFSTNKTNALQE